MIKHIILCGILLNCLAPLIIMAQTADLGFSDHPSTPMNCLGRVFRLWQWEKYWQGSFPGEEKYKGAERSRMVVFSYRSICGLCNARLGICQMYSVDQFGGPVLLNQENIAPGVDERTAAKNFVERGIYPGQLWQGPSVPRASRTAPADQAKVPPGGISGLPTSKGAPGNAGIGLRWEDFTSETLDVALPPMALPAAIAGKMRPAKLEAFKSELKDIFSERPVNPQCAPREVIIPYFSLEDPSVEVLVRDGKCTDTAVTMVRDAITGKWETGGWSDRPAYLNKYRQRILLAEMDRLKIN